MQVKLRQRRPKPQGPRVPRVVASGKLSLRIERALHPAPNILHPQFQTFPQTQSGAIKKTGHQPFHAPHGRNASRSVVSELAPMFEKATGHKTAIQFANNPILKKQIEAGAKFDVLIIDPEMLDDLTKQGMIDAGSRTDMARIGMGLLARAGAAKADISTVDGFKAVLRNAESVAYTGDGHSGMIFLRTLERIGLLQEMKPKLRPVIGKPASPMVANGDVQMYAGPISNPTPGTALVGRFPEEIQAYIGISAGLSPGAATPDVARSFLAFLVSPEAWAIFSKRGFQQVPRVR